MTDWIKCLYLNCLRTASVKVSGGRKPGELFGWSGHYCSDHLHTVIDNQLFQVHERMPIVIEGIF